WKTPPGVARPRPSSSGDRCTAVTCHNRRRAMIVVDTIDSPIGPLTVAERGVKVCMLHFGKDGPAIDRTLERWYPGEARARRDVAGIREVLTRYFGGEVAA